MNCCVCDHQVKPPSRQLYVENHRAHEGMSAKRQGSSGIIIGASIWLAIATNHFWKWLAIWQICTETANGQQLFLALGMVRLCPRFSV